MVAAECRVAALGGGLPRREQLELRQVLIEELVDHLLDLFLGVPCILLTQVGLQGLDHVQRGLPEVHHVLVLLKKTVVEVDLVGGTPFGLLLEGGGRGQDQTRLLMLVIAHQHYGILIVVVITVHKVIINLILRFNQHCTNMLRDMVVICTSELISDDRVLVLVIIMLILYYIFDLFVISLVNLSYGAL